MSVAERWRAEHRAHRSKQAGLAGLSGEPGEGPPTGGRGLPRRLSCPGSCQVCGDLEGSQRALGHYSFPNKLCSWGVFAGRALLGSLFSYSQFFFNLSSGTLLFGSSADVRPLLVRVTLHTGILPVLSRTETLQICPTHCKSCWFIPTNWICQTTYLLNTLICFNTERWHWQVQRRAGTIQWGGGFSHHPQGLGSHK